MIALPEFFQKVTDKPEIFPYQAHYGAQPFTPTLMIVPTGLGKTDAVIVPWLHRYFTKQAGTPKRLVLVLPRQNLTEQTAEVARKRVAAAGLTGEITILQLMGGSNDNDEALRPDQPAIVVCTQDLYLSRALNRGYARRPPRWPMDFALFNNDCQIVFDEVQLMSDGLATSTQLAAFRNRFGVFGDTPCVWMSATVDPAWLDTIDFRDLRAQLRVIELAADDKQIGTVQRRLGAVKRLSAAPDSCRAPKGCAEFALRAHAPGERTLIVCNTVPRAREIYQEVRKAFPDAILLHSRFRPGDRSRGIEALGQIPANGQIVVSTQVLEAGVDISAHRLITDIAPWGSLVQRFGRVNRYGELNHAEIWWVDQPLHSKAKAADPGKMFAPYAASDIEHAVQRLATLTSASPANLPTEDGQAPYRHVLRKADLLDLFDTSSDLAGNEIDVSRFIRSGEERDCYLAWREWASDEPEDERADLSDEELCAVPINDLREFVRKHPVFAWSFVREQWERVDRDRLFPGQLLVTHVKEGGYTPEEGWSPESKRPVPAVAEDSQPADGDSSDWRSLPTYRQTLRDHTDQVLAHLRRLLVNLDRPELEPFRADLEVAAVKHDWGKAHEVMQRTLNNGQTGGELLAKQERSKAARGHCRKHFRHELGSALAMLAAGDSDLAAYVVAAHHGKVRVVIRSMPGEAEVNHTPIARGIRDGETLPACELATGVFVDKRQLSLGVMRLGRTGDETRSWTERAIRLRDELGPFRLAYLEMLREPRTRAPAQRGQHAHSSFNGLYSNSVCRISERTGRAPPGLRASGPGGAGMVARR